MSLLEKRAGKHQRHRLEEHSSARYGCHCRKRALLRVCFLLLALSPRSCEAHPLIVSSLNVKQSSPNTDGSAADRPVPTITGIGWNRKAEALHQLRGFGFGAARVTLMEDAHAEEEQRRLAQSRRNSTRVLVLRRGFQWCSHKLFNV